MNISYETTPQDVLRALGFPDDLMTPGEWVSVRGVQLTKESEPTLTADVQVGDPNRRSGVKLLRFRQSARGWEKRR